MHILVAIFRSMQLNWLIQCLKLKGVYRKTLCQSVIPSVRLSCPLHISWTLWMIFIKLHSNVPLSDVLCRTNDSAMQTQIKVISRWWNLPCVHSTWPNYLDSRSQVKGFILEFCARSISPEPSGCFSLNFTQMQSTWPSYLYSRSRSQVKIMWFTLQFVSTPYLLNPMKDIYQTSLICSS